MDSADIAERRRKVWDMIKDIRVAAMVTREREGRLRSRPMAALGDEFDEALWFFTRAESGKAHEIEEDGAVLLVYSDPKAQRYVSIEGTAELVRDRDRIAKLWSEGMRVWFPEGPDGADVALIRVTMDAAEYWDSPSNAMVVAYGYVAARLTGRTPEIGEHERVKM